MIFTLKNISVIVLLVIANTACTNGKTPKEQKYESRIVSVDKVFSDPMKYQTPVKMKGKVVSVDSTDSLLFVGCEDACVRLPVRFKGSMPKTGASVIIEGAVQKFNDKLLFNASRIETK